MEPETHNDNDQHIIIDIIDDEDSSLGSSLDEENSFSSRLSLSTAEETSDEGECSSTSCCDSVWSSILDLVVTLVQIVAALVILTMAEDEHPQALLLAWLIGYTCGCIISTLLILFWCLRKFEEHSRMDEVTEVWKIGIECFFVLWLILGIVWICDGHSSPSDAPKLYRLCVAFIAFSCIRYTCAVLLCANSIGKGKGGDVFVPEEMSQDDCCSICLGKYEGKKRKIRRLECLHVFHLECINEWLRIKPTCPLCQSLVRG